MNFVRSYRISNSAIADEPTVIFRRPLQRAPVLLILAVIGWPWHIALPVVESSWTVFRTPAGKWFEKFIDRSLVRQAPMRRERLDDAELVVDDADDESE